MPFIREAAKKHMAVLKIHSHPTGFDRFSPIDTRADTEFFCSIHGWVDDGLPHASAVMIPDGRVFGRSISADGTMTPLSCISVAGDNIRFWHAAKRSPVTAGALVRNEQAFGVRTISLLQKLRIAVVGCSGTGSIVLEQLVRLGVGRLLIVDPDRVEEKNLNRILNATRADAVNGTYKVVALRDAIDRIGLGTEVVALPSTVFNTEVIREVAECDILFGCVDSIDARDLLNRISVFYSIPYFDLGVMLHADGEGGVDQICGTVHYLQPDGSSLLSRRVYSADDLASAGLKRTNPNEFNNLLKEKYIRGVQEDRPAVISVNMVIASLAVNEFLARVHPFRDDPNARFASFGISLTQSRLITDVDGKMCSVLGKFAGRGDLDPLLNLPLLSAACS
jgi:hypothetical protein